jgi:hypothetical protein
VEFGTVSKNTCSDSDRKVDFVKAEEIEKYNV